MSAEMADRPDLDERQFDFDLGPADEATGTDTSAIPLGEGDGLDRYARVELLKEEREIAARFHGGPMWGYVAAAFGGFALWLALFPLTMFGLVHPLVTLAISTFLTVAGYVTCHEAMHDNIAPRGSRHRWMNQWVGEVSLLPIAVPFSMGRVTHLEHHKHCNHPEKDPDYTDEAPNMLAAWYKTWWNRQPRVDGTINRYKSVCEALDTEGFQDTLLLAYSAKYASAFYGPFREAVDSQLKGDRRTYQMDAGNRREGVREALFDVDEGADIVMVKPAMAFLDMVREVRDAVDVPVWAYQVSGEYAMIEAAAANGWIDRRAAVLESLLSIRRAGADAVLTYWAVEAAEWLR